MSNSFTSKYTVERLKSQYKSLKEAKAAFNLKARGWTALVGKLNAPSYEQLKEQVAQLTQENEHFRRENKILRQSVSKTENFDEVGFWLTDNNFDRSRFPDFNVPPEATKIESAAKAFYKMLAQKYHPDQGGTEMQMSNLGRLFDQLMVLVEMNDGLGK